MEITIAELTPYVLLIVLLMIYNLTLKSFVPPLKPQVKAFIMLILGIASGNYCINNPILGLIFAGGIYYKHELLDEINATKQLIGMAKEQHTLMPKVTIKKKGVI